MFLCFADDFLGDDMTMIRTLAGDQQPSLAVFITSKSAMSSAFSSPSMTMLLMPGLALVKVKVHDSTQH